MKKNLIALAIFGAFSSGALAQSNVTLYGILDVNYQYNDPNADGVGSTSGINSGHQSGNRWGVRGTEALSPSLNVVFTLEGGFNLDTGTLGQQGGACGTTGATINNLCGGAAQNRLFSRQAWLGLSGGWGTLVAGRNATFSSGTGSFDMYGNTDPFGTGFGDASLKFSSATFPLRVDNSVLYASPDWGGFKFGVGHSFNASGAEVAGSGNNVDVTFTGASFARGPFFGVVTWDRFDIPNGDNQTNLQVGATFDLKFLKLHAGYTKEDNQRVFNVAGITNGADADGWMGGVSVPLAGGLLMASYTKYDGDNGALPAPSTSSESREFKVYAFGYQYPLSRRTNLYASWSKIDAETSTTTAAGVTTTVDPGRKQWTVGMRHLF